MVFFSHGFKFSVEWQFNDKYGLFTPVWLTSGVIPSLKVATLRPCVGYLYIVIL